MATTRSSSATASKAATSKEKPAAKTAAPPAKAAPAKPAVKAAAPAPKAVPAAKPAASAAKPAVSAAKPAVSAAKPEGKSVAKAPAKSATKATAKPAKKQEPLPELEEGRHLSFIVAIADDGAIGKGGKLPWRMPADLQFFKKCTMGKPMLMGRRTFQSFSKPLPGRLHIVLSTHHLGLLEDVVQVTTLKEGIETLQQQGTEEMFIIGGAALYKDMIPHATKAYVTRVHTVVEGADTFFPAIDWKEWKCVWKEKHEADEKNLFPYTFQKWERKKAK